MRGANSAYLPCIAQAFQHDQVFAPVDEVVNLIELDITTEKLQCAPDLCLSFAASRSPYFRCYQGLLASSL